MSKEQRVELQSARKKLFNGRKSSEMTGSFPDPRQILGQVTGIFFESKIDYTTWFGDNVEYIHGIQVTYSLCSSLVVLVA